MNIPNFDYAPLALAFTHVVAGVLVLVVAKLVRGLLSPYSIDEELTSRDNPAFGLAVTGYYAATIIVYVAAAAGPGLPLEEGSRAVFMQLGTDVAWALGGIVALNASRWWMDRLLVSQTRNDEQVKTNRNVAAGMLEFGGFIATGLILAGAIRQPGGTVWTALALFALGQIALIAAGRLYQWWAGYRVADEIRSGNFAAGTAFGLTLIAVALLMMKAASGEFVDWAWNLSFFLFDAIVGVILLLGLRWITDLVLLPNARIPEEIARDHNVNAGLIEGVLAVGIASIILFLF
jgi:uncharacterized membrane protein YjfL (UPF0719 family)